METGRKSEVGWTSIDGVRVPYVVRDDRKFVSVRLLETTLLANYQHVSGEELRKRAPLISFFMTPAEARALNGATCGGYSEHDLIVQLADFVLFYGEVKQRYGRPSRISGGWLQLNSTVMPFVNSDARRCVPLSVVRHAAKLLKGVVVNGRKAEPDESQYLNSMCTKANIPFKFTDSTRLVSVDIVIARSDTKVTVFDLPADDPLAHAYYEYVACPPEQAVPLSAPVSANRIVSREARSTRVTPPVSGTILGPQLNIQYPALGQILFNAQPHRLPVPINCPPKINENLTPATGEPRLAPQGPNSVLAGDARANLNPRSSVVFEQPAPNMVVVPVINQKRFSTPDAVVVADSFPRRLPPGSRCVQPPTASAASPPFMGTAGMPWRMGYPPNRVDMLKPSAPTPGQRSQKGPQTNVSSPQANMAIMQNPVPEKEFQLHLQHHDDDRTQRRKVFANSRCGQIVPVVIHSKTVTCLVNGSGRWVLIEVIARVFFPHVPIADVEKALGNIIGTGLARITPEQEVMFIRFYRLRTDALEFNTVVRVRDLARYLPQLQHLFPEKRPMQNHIQQHHRQQQQLQPRHLRQQQIQQLKASHVGAIMPMTDRLQSPASESDSGVSVSTTDCSDSVDSSDVNSGVLDLSTPAKRKPGSPVESDPQMCVKRLRAGIEDAVVKLRVKQAFVT